MRFPCRCIHVRGDTRALPLHRLETACVGPPERADERVSTEEKVSHMGASVPCNTSPTDGGDIRAADVQMKLTDWLRLNRLHILLRLRRTTSGRRTLENGGWNVYISRRIVFPADVRERKAFRLSLHRSHTRCNPLCLHLFLPFQPGKLPRRVKKIFLGQILPDILFLFFFTEFNRQCTMGDICTPANLLLLLYID